MSNDISSFGIELSLIASRTFPAGISITQLADDTDPFDLPSTQIADKAMGVNGDLVTWKTANPIIVQIAVVPGSEDDRNLSILAQRNRPGKGKPSIVDVVTLVGIYPDNSTVTATAGAITDAMPGKSVASSGRQKSKVYMFAFENVVETPAR